MILSRQHRISLTCVSLLSALFLFAPLLFAPLGPAIADSMQTAEKAVSKPEKKESSQETGSSPAGEAASNKDSAEKKEKDDATEGAKAVEGRLRLPPNVTTQHVLKQNGLEIPYTAVAGTIKPQDSEGKPEAEIFYVSYTTNPTDPDRPITFVFNGGPGAASTYLHLGTMGPKVVDTTEEGALTGPPAKLIPNDASWLDFTDLVFVDPVGTGFSGPAGDKSGKDFWGVNQDAESLADFIRLYLNETDRLGSPVFLAGESYGGFRVAVLARKLQRKGSVSPSGLVLISPALEFSMLRGEDYDPLPWALQLPAYAAVKLESEGTTTREGLAAALKDVEEYAMTDYLVALASGTKKGGKTASARVADITGLPLAKVQRYFARVPQSLFVKEFDRENGQVLSLYDGSVAGPDPHPSSSWPRGPDPVLDATVPLWSSAFVRYVTEDLGYKTDEEFRLLNRKISGRWDYGTSETKQGYAGALDDIQDARAANRNLEVLIASGYTDLITPYTVPAYLVGQLPPLKGANPIELRNYAGGHMLYLRAPSRRDFKQDAQAMYTRALSKKGS
ncbi:MAG: peptidase S10 [Pseudomonadota bacterium]